MKIYHNPRCGKSRAALKYLNDQNREFEIRLYLDQKPTKAELKEILEKSGMKAKDIIRKKEQVFVDNFKGVELAEDQWLEAIIDNPILLERPIYVETKKAAIVRTEDALNTFFD